DSDYIELYNRSRNPVDLTGMTVQYGSATGTFGGGLTFNLSGTMLPGAYYLIKAGSGNSCGGAPCGVPLPVTPDATGSTNLSATDGKVALVTNNTSIGLNCAAATVVDVVGYGSASCFEGAGSAMSGGNTLAIFR